MKGCIKTSVIKNFSFKECRIHCHLYIIVFFVNINNFVLAGFEFIIQTVRTFFFFKEVYWNRNKICFVINLCKKIIYCRQGIRRKSVIRIQKVDISSFRIPESFVSGRGYPSVRFVYDFNIGRILLLISIADVS